MKLKNKNILIIGGTNQIGSTLGFFIERGNNIVIPTKEQFISTPFSLHDCDITNHEELKRVCIKERIDLIINVLEQPTITEMEKFPRDVLTTNYLGTINSLELARELDIGIITNNLFPDLTRFYWGLGTRVVSISFCNVYGPADLNKYHELPCVFREQVMFGKYKNNKEHSIEKQYIFIEDVVEGLKEIIKNFENIIGNHYDIKDNRLFSVKNAMDYWNGKKVIIKFEKKLYSFLGWKPKVSFEKGMDTCKFWYTNTYQRDK